jgi:hypothetical protein
MHVLKVKEDGGRCRALAADTGKLPKVGQGWIPTGTLDLDEVPAEVIASLEKDGYFILPDNL